MTFRTKLLSGLSALAIGAGASFGVAQAQEPAPAPQMEAPTAQAPEMDDTKLKSFAVAFLEVTKVTQAYQPQIEAAGNTEDQQRLQQEAGEKMVEAVSEKSDISVDEYNMIIQAAQTDPELAQRINGHITEAAGGAGGAPAQPEAPAAAPAQPEAPTEPAPAPAQ
ncbi:DUF4168 domain-containing protein [Mesorhizobium sp. CAU 1732]|uniref:DUF4168 domain-containing protein n=1 Tax=Mesorhizobium sp. CAU 1732 TaxID=3140358 RepID=UPI0032616956